MYEDIDKVVSGNLKPAILCASVPFLSIVGWGHDEHRPGAYKIVSLAHVNKNAIDLRFVRRFRISGQRDDPYVPLCHQCSAHIHNRTYLLHDVLKVQNQYE